MNLVKLKMVEEYLNFLGKNKKLRKNFSHKQLKTMLKDLLTIRNLTAGGMDEGRNFTE
jgi:hypothetical protein